MNDSLTFALGALALLATPGPTNALLATSGATRGIKASLPLLFGEAAGYILAVVILRAAVGPFIAAAPAFGQVLSAVVCAYLIYLAAGLWRKSALPFETTSPVTLASVFTTTLLNPKALVFAFTLLPQEEGVSLAILAPWLSALVGLVVLAGSGWIILGATLARVAGGSHRIGYRTGAVVLFVLAMLVGTRSAGLT